MKWFTDLFSPPAPREVVFVDYARGDQMLKANEGWKLAKEEDANRAVGFVYLERPIRRRSQVQHSPEQT